MAGRAHAEVVGHDPETAEKATRRKFTPAYKRKILARTDHASEGQIGALLREEGNPALY
ncbi:hypothetical protein [Nannocystis bainbridge]|uniref:Transposase n=1 Tax=Nannocystis bainbridge TaxID=2995303 RepID=A0ABT5DRT2_9BACT|nr:hypothetical protein [Nannocystis bainbridge]MDC0716256.1 hypothetical protein [Nannocystis bainbridge]